MKTKSPNKTIYRIEMKNGNYTTIAKSVLLKTKLRDSSKTLLQLMLNNEDDWSIVLEYYRKKLKWCKNKLAGAVKDLIDNGYLIKNNNFNPKTQENHYYWVVSEYGNLIVNKDGTNEEMPLDEVSLEAEPKEKLITLAQEEKHPEEGTIQPFKVDVLFWDKVLKVLDEELTLKTKDEYILKVMNYYTEKMDSGEITSENFNENAVRILLREKVAKNKKSYTEEVSKLIDLHNDRGTKDQRANIKAKALIYFTDKINCGDEISGADVSLRLLYLKSSIVDANRNLDQRFQD